MMGLAEAQRAAVHVMDTVLDGVNGSANDAERRVELAVLTRQDDGHVILRRLSSEEVAALREQVKNRRGLTAGPPPPPWSHDMTQQQAIQAAESVSQGPEVRGGGCGCVRR